jgi:hypothetical protein
MIANSHYRPYFCFYMLHHWNEKHPEAEQIKTLKIYYMKEISLPDYKISTPLKEVLCTCEINANK